MIMFLLYFRNQLTCSLGATGNADSEAPTMDLPEHLADPQL